MDKKKKFFIVLAIVYGCLAIGGYFAYQHNTNPDVDVIGLFSVIGGFTLPAVYGFVFWSDWRNDNTTEE